MVTLEQMKYLRQDPMLCQTEWSDIARPRSDKKSADGRTLSKPRITNKTYIDVVLDGTNNDLSKTDLIMITDMEPLEGNSYSRVSYAAVHIVWFRDLDRKTINKDGVIISITECQAGMIVAAANRAITMNHDLYVADIGSGARARGVVEALSKKFDMTLCYPNKANQYVKQMVMRSLWNSNS